MARATPRQTERVNFVRAIVVLVCYAARPLVSNLNKVAKFTLYIVLMRVYRLRGNEQPWSWPVKITWCASYAKTAGPI